ncbi:unnamed protein product [Scytosiphon promiscuus]
MGTKVPKLSRSVIARAAIALNDAEGLEAASMRKLATSMNVDPMAIYHYLPSRSALLDEAAQTVLLEIDVPAPSLGWRDRLRALCRNYRGLAYTHPGVFRVICMNRRWGVGDYRIYEAFLDALAAAGMVDRQVVSATSAFLGYAAGYALDELNGTLGPLDERDRSDMQELDPSVYPTIHRFIGTIENVDPHTDFEFGLDLMLAGLGGMTPK